MSGAGAPNDWTSANQRYLVAAVRLLKLSLRRHSEGGEGDAGEAAAAQAALRETAALLPEPSALDSLCAVFGLSAFERQVLLLCAAMELDSEVGVLVAKAQAANTLPQPTFGLALALFPEDAHWSALVPAAPLRRFRLIEVERGDGPTRARLRIDERILHHLTGIDLLDERLQELLIELNVQLPIPASQAAQAERVLRSWSSAVPAVVQLCGSDVGGRLAVASAVCAGAGLRPFVLRATHVPAGAADRDLFATLWERETLLSPVMLILDGDEQDSDEPLRAAAALVERLRTPLLVSSREPLRGLRKSVWRIDVDHPTKDEQRALWQALLGERGTQLNGALERVLAQFTLSAAAIRVAASGLGAEPLTQGGTALWDACRAQARPRLDDLAQRIEAVAGWDDLVLPATELAMLREIALHVRQRGKVYEEWGFAGKSERGLGISALFSGASGTGKTMAAEVLARDLRLDLYRIDLSQVVSKYIGETEKNLRRIFDAAEQGGAVLLFDEADALFGKRSEVKDSHDRFANIEVSYLLQRMESYRGLALLTTNLKEALDTAFLRRLRFVVHFPFPDAAQRREIWRRVFPACTPVEELDLQLLGRLGIAGGNIRNIALSAAFLAAGGGESVRMSHVLQAARSEYAKLERPLTEIDIGRLS